MDQKLFINYQVSLEFTTKLCASVPADPNLMAKWLEARKPKIRPAGGRSIDEINEEVFATLPIKEEEETKLLIFQRDNSNGGALMVRGDTLRAHLKDCARVISSYYVGKIEGERSFAAKVKNCLWLDDQQYWIPILRPDGSKIFDADGQIEKPIHVTDPRGRPMSAFKVFEFVQPARIDFAIKILGGKTIPLKDLETLLLFGGTHGYAGERSAGEGKYSFKIKKGVSDGNREERNDTVTNSSRVERGSRVAVQ